MNHNLAFIFLKIYLFILNFFNKKAHHINYNSDEDLYQAAQKSYDFVFKANSGILNNQISTNINENPKISVVIPMFNIEDLISRAIISVQNQNCYDFEIIVVNDFSTDHSFNIVNELSKKDNRIKILNNKMNFGLLYSRSLGTLFSKGKYIFPLDGDDLFLINDTLKSIYVESQKLNPDIISFQGISVENINDFFKLKNLKHFRNHKNNCILFQPSIAKNGYGKCSIQAYCVKSSFYKNILNIYGEQIMSENITWLEDCIINFIIHQLCNSFELHTKIGYLHIFREFSSSHIESPINRLKSKVYYLEVVYHFSIFPVNKFRAIKDLIKLTDDENFIYLVSNNKTKILLKYFLNEIIFDMLSLNKTFNSLK